MVESSRHWRQLVSGFHFSVKLWEWTLLCSAETRTSARCCWECRNSPSKEGGESQPTNAINAMSQTTSKLIFIWSLNLEKNEFLWLHSILNDHEQPRLLIWYLQDYLFKLWHILPLNSTLVLQLLLQSQLSLETCSSTYCYASHSFSSLHCFYGQNVCIRFQKMKTCMNRNKLIGHKLSSNAAFKCPNRQYTIMLHNSSALTKFIDLD